MPRKAPKTFEQLAIENGLVTDVQVQECLAVQEDARKDARMPESLETIMLSKGFMMRWAARHVTRKRASRSISEVTKSSARSAMADWERSIRRARFPCRATWR